jgi:CRP-like cAMP-binding protein
LTASAQSVAFEAGDIVFRQAGPCKALYVVVQGRLLRRTDRLETRVTLGLARPGDLVELAAALGEPQHTYSLVAQTPGMLLQLPIEALHRAFDSYPPLRMRLLEELAREVSRGYALCTQGLWGRSRRSGSRSPAA